MKIQTLQRNNIGSVQRECIGDLRQDVRNINPVYHPMQRSREYTRAVTAVKLSRMFAQPLIKGNFQAGHSDSISCVITSRSSLIPLVSGCVDGCIKIWDIPSRKIVSELSTAHSRPVTGLTISTCGQYFYSCSDDTNIHRWSIYPSNNDQIYDTISNDNDNEDDGTKPVALPVYNTDNKNKKNRFNNNNNNRRGPGKYQQQKPAIASKRLDQNNNNNTNDIDNHGPINSWKVNCSVKSIDHHWMESKLFATASEDAVQIWDCTRSIPITTYTNLWNSNDTINKIKYNPSERNLICSTSNDRGIGFYDTRTSTLLKKIILQMNTNDIQWNPMEPMTIGIANEDYNAYTFDLRKLNTPTRIYKGHVNAVLSLSWSPTGREFVTGSYDKTIRIFSTQGNNSNGQSRDVYYTKRMQRVSTVNYTMDNQFIISGSDDTNIRLWKAQSNSFIGKQLTSREESTIQYRNSLIQQYQHVPEIQSIYKSRKIPSFIKNQSQQLLIQKQSQQRKHKNRVKYDNKNNSQYKFQSERSKTVTKQID